MIFWAFALSEMRNLWTLDHSGCYVEGSYKADIFTVFALFTILFVNIQAGSFQKLAPMGTCDEFSELRHKSQ